MLHNSGYNFNKTKLGFTLLELLAVVGIVSILAMITIPSALGLYNSNREMAVASQIAAIFKQAKQEAISSRNNILVSFDFTISSLSKIKAINAKITRSDNSIIKEQNITTNFRSFIIGTKSPSDVLKTNAVFGFTFAGIIFTKNATKSEFLGENSVVASFSATTDSVDIKNQNTKGMLITNNGNIVLCKNMLDKQVSTTCGSNL